MMQPIRQFPLRHLLAPLAIFSGTLFLRLIFIGGPPRSDEGTYAFNAEMVWSGARAYPIAPVNFYPPLLRWVGMPAATPFLHLRIADDLVAAAAAVKLFLFPCGTAGSGPLIAFVGLAQPAGLVRSEPTHIFVRSGFKEFDHGCELLVYVGALWFMSGESKLGAFWAGLLIPVAIFLREAFLPIVAVILSISLPRGTAGVGRSFISRDWRLLDARFCSGFTSYAEHPARYLAISVAI